MGSKAYKLLGMGLAIATGAVARVVLTNGWKAVMATDPPANPEDPDTSWGEAVAWAMVSGAVIATARMLAARQATRYYVKSTGTLPSNANAVT